MKGRHATDQRPALAGLAAATATLTSSALSPRLAALAATTATLSTTLTATALTAFASLAILIARRRRWRWRRITSTALLTIVAWRRRLITSAALACIAQLHFGDGNGGVLDRCKQLGKACAPGGELWLRGQRVHGHHVGLLARTL